MIINGNVVTEYDTEEIFEFKDAYILGFKQEFLHRIIDDNEFISITIPAYINGIQVKFISKRAFAYVRNLVGVKLSKKSYVKVIDDEAFFDCPNLIYVDINRPSLCDIGIKFMSFHSPNPPLMTIVKELDLTNTSINYLPVEAFYCSNIESIKLPLELTIINDFAFCNSNLRKINLNELTKLSYIGNKAFSSCKIEELPKGFLQKNCTYGLGAFSYCTCLEKVYIPENSGFNENCFDNCVNLSTVEFADKNTGIPMKMFQNCPNLQKIKLPQELTTIGLGAFRCDSNLKEIIYPSSLTSIEYEAFSGCSNLKKFIPKSKSNITEIADNAFAYCTSLTNIDINTETLTFIGKSVFDYTVKLQSINLECTRLETIESNTFARGGLQKILFPKTLKEIKSNAFWHSSLESVDLSETELTSIGDGAFQGCFNLSDVKLPFFVSLICKESFDGTKVNTADLIKASPFCEIC